MKLPKIRITQDNAHRWVWWSSMSFGAVVLITEFPSKAYELFTSLPLYEVLAVWLVLHLAIGLLGNWLTKWDTARLARKAERAAPLVRPAQDDLSYRPPV